MMTMTKKTLLALMADLPDEAIVVVPRSDHNYSRALAEVTTVMAYPDATGRAYYTEDHGDGHNDEGGKRIRALVIS